MRRLALAFALLVTSALSASVAHAAARSDRARDEVVRTAPVSASGAPRSLVTLVVGVPTQLQDVERLRFEVQISGAVDVLGRLEGELVRGFEARLRPVLLTLRVPSDALVGLLDVADVVFSAEDGRVVAVPIILRVPAVREIRIAGTKDVRDLAQGDRLELAYQVRNLGNATETFEVLVDAPANWALRSRESRTVTIAPYGSMELAVGLRVPAFLNAGSFAVSVGLRRANLADSAVVARARTSLRIKELERREPGLLFRPFVAMTATGNGTGLGSGMQLAGPIGEKLRLTAQITPVAPEGGPEMYALASVNAMRMPLQATLAAERWDVSVGNALVGFSDLTGVNVSGQGVSGTLRGEGRQASVVVARPGVGSVGGGRVIGAGAWMDHEFGRFTGSISSLSEERLSASSSRQLTAFGADWTSRPMGAVVLSGGLALREYGEGSTLGFRGQFLRETERDRVRLSLLHAPGGSRAFALATDQLQLEARRTLTERVSVDLAATSARDASGAFDQLSSRAISAGPRIQLSRVSALSLRAATQRSDARASGSTGIGGFGSSREAFSATYQTALGSWDLTADGSLSSVTRETELFSGGSDSRTALQRGLGLTVSRTLDELGRIGAGTVISQAGAGVGLPASAVTSFASWSDVPLIVAGQVFRAESQLRLIQTSFDGTRVGMRGGISTSLRSGFDMIATAERNPFVRDAQGRQGWIFALKLSASAEVLSSSSLQTPGTVFEDLNANGRQDANERGVAGVVLRYDNVRMVSGRDGTYRMPASLRGRLKVDAGTLPNGFVFHPRFALDSLERRDIPLVPTGTRAIELRVQPDADGRYPNVDLAQADVWLRDDEGFEWVARHDSVGRFVFEHVPAGEYSLRLGFERLAEPVRADEVRLRVVPGTSDDIVVPVRGRTVRIITPPRGGRSGPGPRNGGVGPRNGGAGSQGWSK